LPVENGKCRITDPPCLLLAGTGLLALLAIVYDTTIPFSLALTSLIALSLAIKILYNYKYIVSIIILIVGSAWLLTFTGNPRLGLLGLILTYLASIIASARAGVNAGLAVFSSSSVPFIVSFPAQAGGVWNPDAIRLASACCVLMAGLVSASLSGKMHPLSITIVAPLVAVLPPQAAASSTAIAFMLAISTAEAIKMVGCPFSVDSGLLFYGTITGIIGVLLECTGLNVLGIGLWATGFLLQLAGVLIPPLPLRSRAS